DKVRLEQLERERHTLAMVECGDRTGQDLSEGLAVAEPRASGDALRATHVVLPGDLGPAAELLPELGELPQDVQVHISLLCPGLRLDPDPRTDRVAYQDVQNAPGQIQVLLEVPSLFPKACSCPGDGRIA